MSSSAKTVGGAIGSVTRSTAQEPLGGSVGAIEASLDRVPAAPTFDLSRVDVEAAWAKAIEILGPGTVTEDMVRAIVMASLVAYGPRA